MSEHFSGSGGAGPHGFDPNQMRLPAGNHGGGQWTRSGTTNHKQSMKMAAKKRGSDAECDAQLKRDTLICNMVKTPQCWRSAHMRYGLCLGGDPVPELRF